MSLVYLDVMPQIATMGDKLVVPSLLPYVARAGYIEGIEKIAIKRPSEPQKLNIAKSGSQRTNIEILLQAGYSQFADFALNIDASLDCFLWSLTMTVEVENPLWDGSGDGSAIKSITWGLGARLGVCAWSVDGDASLTLDGVAAKASLRLAMANYAVQVCGAGAAMLGAFRPLIASATGPFDLEAYAVASSVAEELSRIIPGAGVPPESLSIIGVTVDDDILGLPLAIHHGGIGSLVFACERIWRGKSFNDAVNDPGWYKNHVQFNLVWEVYQDVFGITSQVAAPTQKQKDQAWAILVAGRG